MTKQEQPQTADAEAAAESETEQEEMDQMRDIDEGGAAETPRQDLPLNWLEMTRTQKKSGKNGVGVEG